MKKNQILLQTGLKWNRPIAVIFESAIHLQMATILFMVKPPISEDEFKPINTLTMVVSWIFWILCVFSQTWLVITLIMLIIKREKVLNKHKYTNRYSFLMIGLDLKKKNSLFFPLISFLRRSLACYAYIYMTNYSGL